MIKFKLHNIQNSNLAQFTNNQFFSDEYLEFCKEIGKEPDKEYRGTFNIRINPELHKKLVVVAMKNGDTLNATVEKAIKKYVSA